MYKNRPTNFLIKDLISEGGCCQVYSIVNKRQLLFKEFKNKKLADFSYKKQLKLSSYNLAPKIFSKVIRTRFKDLNDITNWGYLTEKVRISNESVISIDDIQDLVDNIYRKARIKFWDCHYSNIGYKICAGTKVFLCIDCGKESFENCCNAWGLYNPGPICSYCKKYLCECE